MDGQKKQYRSLIACNTNAHIFGIAALFFVKEWSWYKAVMKSLYMQYHAHIVDVAIITISIQMMWYKY